MGETDLAALTSPIADGEPCGPDLDLAGDLDYMNFIAKAESLLPSSFFGQENGKPFGGLQIGGSPIDFAAEIAAMQPLLAQTRDVRLLTILAKFCILNRDLDGFGTAVRALRDLLSERWDEVPPRGADGSLTARWAAHVPLDDLAPVMFPLQYAQLIRHPRIGPISYRSHMIAAGEVAARDGEDNHDLTTVEKALMEGEFTELVQTLTRVDTLWTALTDIRNICTERAGFAHAAKLDRLPNLAEKIRSLLNGFVAQSGHAASLATATVAAGPAGAACAGPLTLTGEVTSLADAAAALAAVAEYFSRHEPSNPALLLVRQAEQLMGKSFLEIMQVLLPAHVEQAAINIGRDQVLQLPLQRLADLGSTAAQSFPDADGDGAAERRLEAKTRADAFKLLEQTAAFYRVSEPSSPLPFLIDRARDLAGRDFLSLLKHVLPEAAFGTQES